MAAHATNASCAAGASILGELATGQIYQLGDLREAVPDDTSIVRPGRHREASSALGRGPAERLAVRAEATARTDRVDDRDALGLAALREHVLDPRPLGARRVDHDLALEPS